MRGGFKGEFGYVLRETEYKMVVLLDSGEQHTLISTSIQYVEVEPLELSW